MTTLRLHNTLTRGKEDFVPLDAAHVRVYACGPTVYDRIHVGNARPIVVFDVLVRLLRRLYPNVTYVRNITDVDDKIITRAAERGIGIDRLCDDTIECFHEDVAALGALPPDHEPRATEFISDMIDMIQTLIDGGFAYAAEGHVLFSVAAMPAYGALSGRSMEDMIAGARVEVAPYKRDPADFVLWKPSSPDQPGWENPFSDTPGRPGWHIECSAMAKHYLGPTFDIHAGGLDLVFPHHENEIAQSCCAHGTDIMAAYWLHNGYVTMGEEKMSKSVGNILAAHEAIAAHRGETVRAALLAAHYRAPVALSAEALAEARNVLDRLYRAVGDVAADEAQWFKSIVLKIDDEQAVVAEIGESPLALIIAASDRAGDRSVFGAKLVQVRRGADHATSGPVALSSPARASTNVTLAPFRGRCCSTSSGRPSAATSSSSRSSCTSSSLSATRPSRGFTSPPSSASCPC